MPLTMDYTIVMHGIGMAKWGYRYIACVATYLCQDWGTTLQLKEVLNELAIIMWLSPLLPVATQCKLQTWNDHSIFLTFERPSFKGEIHAVSQSNAHELDNGDDIYESLYLFFVGWCQFLMWLTFQTMLVSTSTPLGENLWQHQIQMWYSHLTLKP